MDPRLPRGEHCKACKLRWWRLPPSPYFPLDTPMPVSAGGCGYHIILPALQSGGLGQSYHIRVTSERSIPIRAQPRNWRPLSTAILGQRGTAECSHCSLQAIQLSLCTEMHPFTEKEAIIAVKKHWMLTCREKCAACVCSALWSVLVSSGGLQFCNLDFTQRSTFLACAPATCSCLQLVHQAGWSLRPLAATTSTDKKTSRQERKQKAKTSSFWRSKKVVQVVRKRGGGR